MYVCEEAEAAQPPSSSSSSFSSSLDNTEPTEHREGFSVCVIRPPNSLLKHSVEYIPPRDCSDMPVVLHSTHLQLDVDVEYHDHHHGGHHYHCLIFFVNNKNR